MVRALVPSGAVLLAVRINCVELLVTFGANDAVTPTGSPETERLTKPEKPYSGLIETEVPVEVPWPMLTVPGDDSVKVGVKIDSANVVAAVSLPEVPVIVTVLVPTATELAAVRVNIEYPVVGFGENDAVTPVGRPDAARLTLPENPY